MPVEMRRPVELRLPELSAYLPVCATERLGLIKTGAGRLLFPPLPVTAPVASLLIFLYWIKDPGALLLGGGGRALSSLPALYSPGMWSVHSGLRLSGGSSLLCVPGMDSAVFLTGSEAVGSATRNRRSLVRLFENTLTENIPRQTMIPSTLTCDTLSTFRNSAVSARQCYKGPFWNHGNTMI